MIIPKTRKFGDYFAVLTGDTSCEEVAVGRNFWEEGIAKLPTGRLVSLLPTGSAWPTWERHPHGEEFILQLAGALELILDDGTVHQPLRLESGEFIVMPAGWWHTADTSEVGQALFITPGEGTEVRQR